MKTNNLIFNTITLLMLIMSIISCSSDECAYDTNNSGRSCAFTPVNTEHSGWAVATCYAANLGDPVGVIYNTSMNSSATPGTDWGAILTGVDVIHPTNWTPADIGQVFGIAIDKDENIYLAASHIYAQGVIPTPAQNSLPSTVYKCSPPNFNATLLFSLANTGIGNLNGLGNIAYDKVNDQLFVTNLENGKIFRYSTSGSVIGAAFDPWTVDTGTAGIATLDEQVWGIGVNYEAGNVKVYFPRITAAGDREMYSVTLDSSGGFPTGTNPEVLEFSGIPGNQLSISDIAFSSNGNEMLLSERGHPHQAKVMSYTKTSSWAFNRQYFSGSAIGENSAGGVDFAYKESGGNINSVCDEFFWATSNYMDARTIPGKLYGLEGIKYTGNLSSSAVSPTANQDTDLFIDFNGTYSTADKNTIGDVEVFDANECFDICP